MSLIAFFVELAYDSMHFQLLLIKDCQNKEAIGMKFIRMCILKQILHTHLIFPLVSLFFPPLTAWSR